MLTKFNTFTHYFEGHLTLQFWITWQEDEKTLVAWLLLGNNELSSTKEWLSRQNPCSAPNTSPMDWLFSVLTSPIAHQYGFWNPIFYSLLSECILSNNDFGVVHHIVILRRWKELTTQHSRIKIDITEELIKSKSDYWNFEVQFE